jgi:hypothetical protein
MKDTHRLADMFRDMWRRDLAELQRILASNPGEADAKRYREAAKFLLECLRDDDKGVFERVGCNADDIT